MMANTFRLAIYSLNRAFFQGDAESIIFDSTAGEIEIMAQHAPLISSLGIGEMRIKTDGVWKSAFVSEGFVDVRLDGVHVFAQACEWVDEIDEKRAMNAKERALAHLQHYGSVTEQRHNTISLARAMERLRLKNRYR